MSLFIAKPLMWLPTLLLVAFPSHFPNHQHRNELLVEQNSAYNKLIINRIIETENAGLIDSHLERFRERVGLKGIAVAIVKDDKLIFAKGYGYADVENQTPATPNQLFRIASVSKLVTAVAVMKLVENSKLRLESQVFGKYGILNDEKFLPLKDPRMEKVTVRNLLNHSGGWTQHYGDLAFLPRTVAKGTNHTLPVDLDAYIEFVTHRRLHFEPGTISAYSNLGYMILGKVIEKVSGMSYEHFVQKEVLEPAGITDMQLAGSWEENRLSNEVRYYQPDDPQLTESYDGSGRKVTKIYGANDMKTLGSAGGWLASAVDLMKLMVVIDDYPGVKDILSHESIDQMTRPDPLKLDPLGWRGTLSGGTWWRTGTLVGTSALMKRQSDGLCWVILSNTSNHRGPHLALEMDHAMSQLISKVKQWPDYNLFAFMH